MMLAVCALLLCLNRHKPAKYIATLPGGDEFPTCGTCNRGTPPVSVREVGSEDTYRAPSKPLTVAEAADRERVNERTVYRWLSSGQLEGGAWRKGTGDKGPWLIDPAALDARKIRKGRPTPRPKPVAPKRPGTKPSTTAHDMGWPA